MDTALEKRLADYVDSEQGRLITLIRELVRRPSENTPPVGNEAECQQYTASVLSDAGLDPHIYSIDEVAGLREHPLFTPGRDYRDRANVAACRAGSGQGRSLLLSSHIDTVPRGTLPWTRDAFGAKVEANRLYGRGANDMKAGAAINLFVVEALEQLQLHLAGDVIVESVVDEEFGGVNGTLAARLSGYTADAAVLTEPSSLRICPAQRGGRTVHLTFSSYGGVLAPNHTSARVMDQVTHFLNRLPDFAEQRRKNCIPHALYADTNEPVPVAITKLTTGPWGTGEPITLPEVCQVELYWQLMPGEEQHAVDAEFHAWFASMINEQPQLFSKNPIVEFPIRWLPGSTIDVSQPLVTGLADAAEVMLHRRPVVAGIEGPCDLFIFHAFDIPAVLWGPSGGNTHGADEYVELDTVVAAAKALLLFVCRWCGTA